MSKAGKQGESRKYHKGNRPFLYKETNFLCGGCYTTQTRIKTGNRKSEAMLNEVEAISVV